MSFDYKKANQVAGAAERGDEHGLGNLLRDMIEQLYGPPLRVDDAAFSVSRLKHHNRTVLLSRAAGQAIALPPAIGDGTKLRFVVETTITSNATVFSAARAADVMAGVAMNAADAGNTVVAFETAADSDTISLNGGTTGGIRGDVIELEDVADGLWSVNIRGAGTGTEATPFSAAVS